jgi:hypothetical protein
LEYETIQSNSDWRSKIRTWVEFSFVRQ